MATGAILCWKCLVLLLQWREAAHGSDSLLCTGLWFCTTSTRREWLHIGLAVLYAELTLVSAFVFSMLVRALWPCSCSTFKSYPQPNHYEAEVFLQNSCPLFVLRYLFLCFGFLLLWGFGLFLSIHSGVCLLLSFPQGILLLCNNNKVGRSRVVIKRKLGITLVKS